MLIALLTEQSSADTKGGFPPFETWHWPSQAAWLVITVGALLFVLWRFILPRIRDTLETRQETILSGLDEAQKLTDQARDAEIALEKRIADARARARSTASAAQDSLRETVASQTLRAGAELDARLAAAESQIGALRDNAMSQVGAIAVDATTQMVARLGGKASPEDISRAVASALNPEG